MEILFVFIKETAWLWLEMAPFLLLGITIAGLLHIFLGKEFISRQLGKPGFVSIIKATLLGIPLPVCSCGVIPLASSIKKDGAHKSNVLSFLVSTPTTGVDSMFATYSLLGPLFAIFRPLAALLSGIVVGGLDLILERKQEQIKEEPSKATHTHQRSASKLKEFIRYSFLEIPQDIGKWLILGTIIGGIISTLIPQALFTRYLSFPFDLFIVLLISVPLYVCATGSIPVAASLIYKGISPGAALIFLIAGPATNAITLSFVRAKLGRKSFYIYLMSIISISLLMGLIFNYLWVIMGKDPQLITGAGMMLSFEIKLISGIVLLLVIANAALKARRKAHLPKLHQKDSSSAPPDATCTHCEKGSTS